MLFEKHTGYLKLCNFLLCYFGYFLYFLPVLTLKTFLDFFSPEISVIVSDYIVRFQRRQWQPTPILLPEDSQGWGSLVGCHLWGHTESDTTEVI